MKRLAVIGGGNVGRTLACLWHRHGVFDIDVVKTRSSGTARRAVQFVGAGRPAARWDEVADADVYMIAVPDDAIEECARRLAARGVELRGRTVFHCSGSKSSDVLAAVGRCGADIASVHPVKSFADPRLAAETFNGTYCAIEGDPAAGALLQRAFETIGGHCFAVDSAGKMLYHAGTVFVSNYFVALLEIGIRCFEKAGVRRDEAGRVVRPLVRGTLDNIDALGTIHALTGPVARGDSGLVVEQLQRLAERDMEAAALYASLGSVAVELARDRGAADESRLAEIERTFASFRAAAER